MSESEAPSLICLRELVPASIPVLSVTLDVSKLLKYKLVNPVEVLNIEVIFVTAEVFKPLDDLSFFIDRNNEAREPIAVIVVPD